MLAIQALEQLQPGQATAPHSPYKLTMQLATGPQ